MTQEGIDLEKHPILSFLVDNNMQGLYFFAKDYGYQDNKEGYLSKCHLCLDIRSFLITQKNYPELQPKEFYENIKDST